MSENNCPYRIEHTRQIVALETRTDEQEKRIGSLERLITETRDIAKQNHHILENGLSARIAKHIKGSLMISIAALGLILSALQIVLRVTL